MIHLSPGSFRAAFSRVGRPQRGRNGPNKKRAPILAAVTRKFCYTSEARLFSGRFSAARAAPDGGEAARKEPGPDHRRWPAPRLNAHDE